ncbi:DUF2207 domain-containing protein [Bhargavaea ullalensis]|uniref:Membrane protein YgcG n=1 Tax=Bhargavaea ullalensis TaxID=1265685 RepID=A0ABV2G9V7_9BACL
MKRLMPVLIAVLTVCAVLLLPGRVLAVDYDIEESTIDAQADENGRVFVTEHHTYSFSGKFNGITRLLVPKTGTDIIDFSANEGGRELRTEKDGDLYKVHRNGKSETVTVEMRYTIMDAIVMHEDGAEFHWPFFDDRNESDYDKMTITIRPPAASSGTEALGYDALSKTERVEPDGAVAFGPVRVPSGSNGDIRVVFDSKLFPALTSSGGTIRDKLAAERKRIADEAAAAQKRHEQAVTAGNVALPAAGAVLLFILVKEWMIARRKKDEARRETDAGRLTVPDGPLSMPAVLQFVEPAGAASPEWLSAALLDLIRKGLVTQVSDEMFERTDNVPAHRHEQILLNLLFGELADAEGRFDLGELPEMTKSEKMADRYEEGLAKWFGAVNDESKETGFREKRTGAATLLSAIGIFLIGLSVYFGIAGAFVHLAVAIVLTIALFATALFLKPLTREGHRIRTGWKAFSEQFDQLDPGDWQALPKDDRLRGYIYAVGSKNKHLGSQFEQFGAARRQRFAGPGLYADPFIMSHSFSLASANASTYSSSTAAGSVGGGGGGTGGGGGGSGAF